MIHNFTDTLKFTFRMVCFQQCSLHEISEGFTLIQMMLLLLWHRSLQVCNMLCTIATFTSYQAISHTAFFTNDEISKVYNKSSTILSLMELFKNKHEKYKTEEKRQGSYLHSSKVSHYELFLYSLNFCSLDTSQWPFNHYIKSSLTKTSDHLQYLSTAIFKPPTVFKIVVATLHLKTLLQPAKQMRLWKTKLLLLISCFSTDYLLFCI